MNLGKCLRVALAMKEIKQKDLAKELNTSEQQVSNWVTSGAIKQSSIEDLAVFFGMKDSEFIALGEK